MLYEITFTRCTTVFAYAIFVCFLSLAVWSLRSRFRSVCQRSDLGDAVHFWRRWLLTSSIVQGDANDVVERMTSSHATKKRLDHGRRIAGSLTNIAAAYLLYELVRRHRLGVWQSDFAGIESPVLDRAFYTGLLVCVGMLWSKLPERLTPRRVDILHVLFTLRMIAPILVIRDPFNIIYRGRNMLATRMCFSLVLGNVYLTLMLNIMVSVTTVLVYFNSFQDPLVAQQLAEHFSESHLIHLILDEAVGAAVICAVARSLQNRILAEARATVLENKSSIAVKVVDMLLRALSDAVVYVNSNLEIENGFELLEAILLRRGIKSLKGACVVDLLAVEDRQRFTDHLHASTKQLNCAMCLGVHFLDSLGNRIGVNLYSACVEKLDGLSGYVICICESSRVEHSRDSFPAQNVQAAAIAPTQGTVQHQPQLPSRLELADQAVQGDSESACTSGFTLASVETLDDMSVWFCPLSFDVISSTVAMSSLIGPSIQQAKMTDMVADSTSFSDIVQEQFNFYEAGRCPYRVTVESLRVRPQVAAKAGLEYVVRCKIEVVKSSSGVSMKATFTHMREKQRRPQSSTKKSRGRSSSGAAFAKSSSTQPARLVKDNRCIGRLRI
eukprot:TRINITY_DN8624_c0_g1_i4.p1 TRINITY_DN8624_c0_g1~~TRINITY_DN8624_c0_g1_i4.p1  ORF type:complete len:611 (-),score=41.68 TRINITY_DN8624_c0_g1_i4:286-2118(-)